MHKNTVFYSGLVVALVLIGSYCSRASNGAPLLRGQLTANAVAGTSNSNWIVKEYRRQLVLECSSAWNGWPVEKLVDQNPYTSWFSASRDAAAHDKQPWVMLTFPQNVAVRHVTALGNQEPSWLHGFSIKQAKFELLDSEGRVVYSAVETGVGSSKNFDLKLKKPVSNVRRIRFTSLSDEGDKNVYADIALAELQIE